MVIIGTTLLAACYLLGILLGDALGAAIGINANVGGVGFAMPAHGNALQGRRRKSAPCLTSHTRRNSRP